jgi:hypothetical protein
VLSRRRSPANTTSCTFSILRFHRSWRSASVTHTVHQGFGPFFFSYCTSLRTSVFSKDTIVPIFLSFLLYGNIRDNFQTCQKLLQGSLRSSRSVPLFHLGNVELNFLAFGTLVLERITCPLWLLFEGLALKAKPSIRIMVKIFNPTRISMCRMHGIICITKKRAACGLLRNL